MEVLNTFMTEEEVRMVRVLLANTQLTVRVSNHLSNYFPTTIGTPQGDSLSPVLFTVYLEAALREVRLQAPQKVVGDIHLPFELVYADDTDFMSTSRQWLQPLEPILTYNCGTWGVTETCFNQLDSFHRRQLRSLLGIK